jgi:hypothetical protein
LCFLYNLHFLYFLPEILWKRLSKETTHGHITFKQSMMPSIELAGYLHEVLADEMVAHIRHIRLADRNSSQLPEQGHMLTILVCWRIPNELKASTNRMKALYINVICSTRLTIYEKNFYNSETNI